MAEGSFKKRSFAESNSVEETRNTTTKVETDHFHYKLWIASINQLEKHPFCSNAGYFRGKLVSYVDIIGSVVGKGTAGKVDFLFRKLFDECHLNFTVKYL